MQYTNTRFSILLLLLFPLWAMAEERVLFLYEEGNDSQQKYIEQSQSMLQLAMPDVVVKRVTLSDASILSAQAGDRTLLITVGSAAANYAVASALPTLNTLITRRNFESMEDSYRAPVTAIYLEQPVLRQLQLIRVALPERDNVTVMLGPDSEGEALELNRESRGMGLDLKVITVDEDSVIEKLFGQELLSADTLLLLPDPLVVNRKTVKPLVLGSYRQGVPLVGYSQALVKAGALMAVHSNLEILEREMLDVVSAFFSRGRLPLPRYARDMEVSVNYQLARALNLSLPSEDSLRQKLQGMRQ